MRVNLPSWVKGNDKYSCNVAENFWFSRVLQFVKSMVIEKSERIFLEQIAELRKEKENPNM